jgi:hypothetical protein
MKKLWFLAVVLFAIGVCGDGVTPISGLKLETDMDANGNSISNIGLLIGNAGGLSNFPSMILTNGEPQIVILTNGTIHADGIINGTNCVWWIPPNSTNRYYIPFEKLP